MPLPDRLRAARERSGLTQAEASLRSGVGESSLSDFEGGKREPSLGQLDALARAYHRPFAWFMAEDATINPEPLVLWRQRPATGAKDVEARFLELCHTFRRLEILENEPPAPSLPQAAGRASDWDYRKASELAHTVRRTLALGDRPAPALLRILEEVWRIKVFHLDFEPEGAAASHASEEIGHAILLNRRNVRWRRNHDLAHELFHLLTWNVFHGDSASAAEAGDREEKLATAFAAALLMPEETFRAAVDERTRDGAIGPDALQDVARSFDVSVESATWRLHSVYGRRAVDSPLTRQLIEKARALAPAMTFRHDTPAPELPARFESLAWHALRAGRLSVGTCARMLNLPRAQVLRLLDQGGWNGQAIPIPAP